jgi:hypothetical protein
MAHLLVVRFLTAAWHLLAELASDQQANQE